MSGNPISRREALKLVGIAGAGALSGAAIATGAHLAREPAVPAPNDGADAGAMAQTAFFTPAERRTVQVIVDDILPRDERSGSATDAKVPEFLEATLLDPEVTSPLTQLQMRGGLAWLDTESRRRYGRPYADCETAERHRILDDIAWPAKASPALRYGAEFFTGLRDFTASGFFSSAMGYQDLDYRGNRFVSEWTGCPDAALEKLGVSYAAFDARYGGRPG